MYITSCFGPDVEHVVEQVDVFVQLVCRRRLQVAGRIGGVLLPGGGTDKRRAETDGQLGRGHLVDV